MLLHFIPGFTTSDSTGGFSPKFWSSNNVSTGVEGTTRSFSWAKGVREKKTLNGRLWPQLNISLYKLNVPVFSCVSGEWSDKGGGRGGGWVSCMFSYSSTICQAASGSTVWRKGLKEQGQCCRQAKSTVPTRRLLLLHVAFFVLAFILVRPFVKRSTWSSSSTHELDALTLTNPLTRITKHRAVTSSKINTKLISCYCWIGTSFVY